MWWKLTGLGLIEAALIAVLFVPIKTHAVLIEIPRNGPIPPAPDWGLLALPAIQFGVYALLLAVLAVPVWMAYIVVRAARR